MVNKDAGKDGGEAEGEDAAAGLADDPLSGPADGELLNEASVDGRDALLLVGGLGTQKEAGRINSGGGDKALRGNIVC